MKPVDVIIIGAGFSGLSAAYYLQRKGLTVKVLEVSSQAGGRARSDKMDGLRWTEVCIFITIPPQSYLRLSISVI